MNTSNTDVASMVIIDQIKTQNIIHSRLLVTKISNTQYQCRIYLKKDIKDFHKIFETISLYIYITQSVFLINVTVILSILSLFKQWIVLLSKLYLSTVHVIQRITDIKYSRDHYLSMCNAHDSWRRSHRALGARVFRFIVLRG